MDDESNIWLVDTHTKRNRCHYHLNFIFHPLFLNPWSIFALTTSMIIIRLNSLLRQEVTQLLTSVLGSTVNDSRVFVSKSLDNFINIVIMPE